MRETKPSRRKHIFMITTIIVLGLIIGSLAVWGFNPSREFSRLAGVGYLERIGFECQEELINFGHYETECYFFPRASWVYEDTNPAPRRGAYSEALPGIYPWIWHPVNKGDHLQHNASRQEIVYNEALDRFETFFEVATAPLDQTNFSGWSIDASQPWQIAPLPYHPIESDDCHQSPDAFDIRDTIETYAWYEVEGSTLELSNEVRAVIKIPEVELMHLSMMSPDPLTDFFCVNVQYTLDDDNIQSAWVKFALPWPDFINQAIERGNNRHIIEVFGEQDAQQILESQQSSVIPGADIDITNQPVVPLQYVVVALPADWTTLTFAQKQDLNPYGCQYLYEIDLETGRCLEDGYELSGSDGTPDWLTIDYTTWVSVVGDDSVQALNPYGCWDLSKISLNGRCLGGLWRVSDYSDNLLAEDVLVEAGNNDVVLNIDAAAMQGVTLRVLTFADQTAKEDYFLTNPYKHPCRLVNENLRDYVIEGDLYLIYPDDSTIDGTITPHPLIQVFTEIDLKYANGNHQLHGYVSCKDIIKQLYGRAISICLIDPTTYCQPSSQASELSELIEPVAEVCQAMYERVTNENLDAPLKTDLADCLQLRDTVRDDFLEVTSLDSPDDTPEGHLLGWYEHSTKTPHTIWQEGSIGSAYGQQSFEYVALHEYLHKVYFQDLTFKERMRYHQEILRFYEDKTKVMLDFIGSSNFGFETKHKAARHQDVSTISINDIQSIIDRFNDDGVASQIRATLPEELQQEYAEFLNDRHGLVAFLYGLTEIQNNNYRFVHLKSIDTELDDFALNNEINNIFTESIGSDYEETGRVYDSFVLRCARSYSRVYYTDCLDLVLYHFFTESYAMIGPTSTVSLSTWLENHFNEYFDRHALTHYFRYNIKSEFDYFN